MLAKSEAKQLGLFEELAASKKQKQDAPSQPPTPCTYCTEQYLSDHQVGARFEISKATVWRWHDSNPNFPRRIKLSPGTSRWKLSELVRFEANMQAASTANTLRQAKGGSK